MPLGDVHKQKLRCCVDRILHNQVNSTTAFQRPLGAESPDAQGTTGKTS